MVHRRGRQIVTFGEGQFGSEDRLNHPRHRIAATSRFGMKMKGCGWAARGELGR